ncbi:MAG: GNAT family N-acetyltransferase [Candidatus Neomarinimicrobiota bacterium]|nr:MAG: GNAT family N-acetyltransferase [Candidatus Neomarinimicrobiota bacterium]
MAALTIVEKYEIRPATVGDVSLILSFIRQLAEYEQALNEVVATEYILRESLFGKHPCAEVIIGYFNSVPVSFAVYFYNFSTWLGSPGLYLEDIYVKPEYRHKGFARAMMIYLAKLAKERNCGRFEWSVLNWNKSAIRFYKRIGAVPMDEWTVYRLTGDALDKLAAEN